MKIMIACLLLLLTASCSVQGLTDDYGKLSDEQKTMVLPLENFNEIKSRSIYKVTGKQLFDEIKTKNKALVYVFTNGCSSDHCKPMFVYENFARENGYQLYLVMAGFANLNATVNQPFTSPLYAIDGEKYNTIYRGKYTRMFCNELMGKDQNEKAGPFYGSLYFYENGAFVKVVNDLPNVHKYAGS